MKHTIKKHRAGQKQEYKLILKYLEKACNFQNIGKDDGNKL